MAKHIRPIIGEIRSDVPMPERPRPGAKPLAMDDEYVREAINGINNGIYKTPYKAANEIASGISNTEKEVEANRKRILRKIEKQLIRP